MEENVSVWKANLTNGLILGLIGIVYSLLMYFFNLTFNKALGYILLLILIVALYFLVKSYRDNYLHGYITFGRAFGAGVIISLYFAIISAIFVYVLYKIIDPGLMDKSLAYAEETMTKKEYSQEIIESGMKMQRKMMKPEIMSLFGFFVNMVYGAVMALLVGIFVRKEGNPLIDAPDVK